MSAIADAGPPGERPGAVEVRLLAWRRFPRDASPMGRFRSSYERGAIMVGRVGLLGRT